MYLLAVAWPIRLCRRSTRTVMGPFVSGSLDDAALMYKAVVEETDDRRSLGSCTTVWRSIINRVPSLLIGTVYSRCG